MTSLRLPGSMMYRLLDSMSVIDTLHTRSYPDPAAALRLIKPITWFPPMWAFVCGAISSGVSPEGRWGLLALGSCSPAPSSAG